ncbi:hypothetical protein DW193_13410 [Phocaeicola vulgatus]|uniref:Uncharacterized protein n=1 Tax=Phocaeicola vulgatus TaxID=821 RepID=A0A414XSV8_PHOVU|nr:hypothetical protein C5Z04_20070 [Phocaeicola vulgatus]HAZ52082.1 hypothetical protein [Bacteroides sp.]RGJ44730.1 hypothetical protein DXD64_00745 [Phocaeicola vulgatus]RGS98998.1 hypothetical protein DWX60_13820 [Phocaeicola vulgatus]RGW11735.1 hypothetical protein DWV96_02070 [Phocaeicola vulgatus]
MHISTKYNSIPGSGKKAKTLLKKPVIFSKKLLFFFEKLLIFFKSVLIFWKRIISQMSTEILLTTSIVITRFF